jgi:hypothetical protein
MGSGGNVRDRVRDRNDEDLYGGLRLSDEESDWVRHYLRVADHVLFGRRPASRAFVVEDDWRTTPRPATLGRKDRAA